MAAKVTMNLGNACSGFSDAEIDELKAIARTYDEASGLIIKLSAWIGDRAGSMLTAIPGGWSGHVHTLADFALRNSYAVAAATQADASGKGGRFAGLLRKAQGETWHKAAAAVSGAVGGLGGVATVGADLAATTVLTMRSIQQVAASYGEDIADEEVRLNCLAVFGFGGPLSDDDEVETGLYAARMALTGKSLTEMVKRVLPRFGVVVSEKLLAGAAPVLGAAAGATINPVFVGYYQQMAHVHFRLRRLEARHDKDRVHACFERVMKTRRAGKKR